MDPIPPRESPQQIKARRRWRVFLGMILFCGTVFLTFLISAALESARVETGTYLAVWFTIVGTAYLLKRTLFPPS